MIQRLGMLCLLLAMCGCVTDQRLGVKLNKPTYWRSENGTRFVACYGELSDESLSFVRVTAPDGTEYTLPRMMSGSGVKYADGLNMEWWEHHGEVRAEVRRFNEKTDKWDTSVWMLRRESKANKPEGEASRTLAQTHWVLTAWSAPSPAPSRFNITADFSDKRLTGSAAVNMYEGSYTATPDGGFKAMDVASTLKGGSKEAMRAESLYLTLLRQATTYVIKGKALTLKDKNNHDLLIFKAR